MSIRNLLFSLLLLPALLVSAADAPPPLRVLIFSGKNNHKWQETTPVLQKILVDSKRFTVDITEHPEQCDDALLAKYDVIVSNWTNWPDVEKRVWGDKAEKAVLDFVRGGKGYVTVHAAGSVFYSWPEFQQLVGSWWKLGQTGHGPVHEFKVAIADANHPITKGLADFTTTDELWHKSGTAGKLNVLCSALSEKTKGGSGDVEPMAHWRDFGKGRCFHLILGHDAAAMRNAGFQSLLLRGTEWAATGQVTIAAASASDPFKDLPAYHAGESRQALAAIAKLVAGSSADPMKRDAMAGRLVVILKSADATRDARAFVLEQLGLIGRPSTIEAVVPLFTDDKEFAIEHMRVLERLSVVDAIAPLLLDDDLTLFARRALERIGHTASVNALLAVLPKAKGPMLVGIINSLGTLGDEQARDALSKIVATNSDREAVLAAIDALGQLRFLSTFGQLTSLRQKATDATLVAAIDRALLTWGQNAQAGAPFAAILEFSPAPSRTVRVAALHGLLMYGASKDLILKTIADPDIQAAAAAAETIVTRRDNQTAEYAKAITSVPVANRPLLIAALGRRGHAAAFPAILAATADPDPATRAAAYEALPAVADETVIVALVDRIAKSATDRPLIAATLRRIREPGSDAALIAVLKLATPATQAFLIPIVTARQIADATPMLSELAASPDRDVRMAAIAALKGLVTPADLTPLLATLARLPDDESRASLEPILGGLVAAKPDADLLLKSLDAAPPAAKPTIVRLLTRAPSPATLDALRKSLGDAALKDAAVRSLCDWPDVSAEPDLVTIASKTDNVTHNVLAIRGLVRLASNPSLHNKPAAIELLNNLAPLARRDEEKKLITDALARCNSATNLARIAKASSPDGLADDGASKGEAAAIDGEYDTYWDKTDDQRLYRLVLTWPTSVPIHAIRIIGYQQHNYAPKDFIILVDDKPIQQIKGATYDNNMYLVKLPQSVSAKTLELKITAYYGRSPGIRELEVFDDGPLPPSPAPKKK